MCCNVDGESVLNAAKRLLTRQEERKIMLVFSDGNPSGQDGDDTSKLETHLLNTVQNLQRMGIECFGFGICSDEVKDFYPNYAVLNKVEDLPEAVLGKLRSILI
jgi:cobalamin biosynthesis protein CobT